MPRTTPRGFRADTFLDANGVECSIQESSRMDEEGLIWLGADDIGLKRFSGGWQDVPLPRPEDRPGTAYLANTRMHLTQSQVRRLLPALTHFAEHGALPEDVLDHAPEAPTPEARVPGITLSRLEAAWAELCAADHFEGPFILESRNAGRDAFLNACQAVMMVLAEPAPGEEALAAARDLRAALEAWKKEAWLVTIHGDRRPFWLAGVGAHNAHDRLKLALAG